MKNPNNCATCDHKQHPDGGWCYMFRDEPDSICRQHTFYKKPMQDLLNMEARFKNAGKHAEAEPVIAIIRDLRGKFVPPCFGHDDCSTNILMRCPWRMDCGT